MSGRHGKQTISDGLHPIVARVYADATDREADTPVSPSDALALDAANIGIVARQADVGSYWTLESVGPLVWQQLNGNDVDALHASVAGEINALGDKASPTVSDVVVIEDAADSFGKKKVTIGSLPVVLPARTITVAATGASETTIADALAAATALTPTESAPVTILVYPATYNEAPFALPSFVALVGVGGHEVVRITATTTTAVLAALGDDSSLVGIALMGADGAGGVAVRVDGGHAELEDIVISDCTTGIEVDGSGSRVRAHRTKMKRVAGETLTTACTVTGGAVAEFFDSTLDGESGAEIAVGFQCSGAGSALRLASLISKFCDNPIYALTGGAKIEMMSAGIETSDVALKVGVSGEIHATGVDIEESSTWDLQTLDATSVVRFVAGILRHEKVSLATGSNFVLSYLSETPNDEAQKILAELHVGDENNPRESCFGGGDSHVRGMVALTNTNLEAGSWVDITSIVNIDDGSVDIFAGVGAGNCTYVGGDLPFPGIKAEVTTALVVGAGEVVSEYWNGSAWVSFDAMSTDAQLPYGQYGLMHLLRVNTEQIRWDWPSMTVDWATKSLDGNTKYWARYRIVTAITTIPQIDYYKLHTHRTEINPDGFSEAYGDAERIGLLTFAQPLTDDLSGASPSSVALELATGLTITPNNNSYNNNALDGVGAILQIPEGLDTSRPLTMLMAWRPSTAATGDAELEIDYAVLKEGDTVDGSASVTNAVELVPLDNQQDELILTEFEIRVPTAVPGGLLALSSFRDATAGNPADTFAGSVEVIMMQLTGTYWR